MLTVRFVNPPKKTTFSGFFYVQKIPFCLKLFHVNITFLPEGRQHDTNSTVPIKGCAELQLIGHCDGNIEI
jgi:hypothetical protein